MATNIFVGYSASDFSFSEALMTALAATGMHVWHEEQPSEATSKLLSECQIFCLVLSKGALLSPTLRNQALEYATLHNFHPDNRMFVITLEPLSPRDLWLFIRHDTQLARGDEEDAVFIHRIVQELATLDNQASTTGEAVAVAAEPGVIRLNGAATGKRRGKNQWRPIFAITLLVVAFLAVVAIAGWQVWLVPHAMLPQTGTTASSDGATATSVAPVLTPPITPSPRAITTTQVEATATPHVTVTPHSTSATFAPTVPTVTGTPVPTVDFSHGFTSTSTLQMNGGASLNGTALQLTDNNYWEARSSFYTTPVNITGFTCHFTFQATNPNASADGITFTIQNNNPAVVGPAGGDLGYTGIGNSVAVKLDLYSTHFNTPDGQASTTGLYLNGASPDQPEILLPPSMIFRSGDVFDVVMTYKPGSLATTITDTSNNVQFSQSYAVDIPGTVGSNTAYIGFTAATGGLYTTQEILSWSYLAQ